MRHSNSDPVNMLAVPGQSSSSICIHDTNNMSQINSLIPSGPDIDSVKRFGMCMTIRSGGNDSELLAGYEDGTIALWDLRTCKIINRQCVHKESVMCMDYDSASSKGLSGSVDDTLVCWTVTTNKTIEIKSKIQTTNSGFSKIQIRGDKRIVCSAGWDRCVRIFSWKTLKPLAVLDYHKDNVQSLAFSCDHVLACGSQDTHISLWDLYRKC